MKDVNTISMENSTVGANIYNLQNFISTINISETDNPGGLFLGVIMVDNVVVPAGGVQLINLTNAGTVNVTEGQRQRHPERGKLLDGIVPTISR